MSDAERHDLVYWLRYQQKSGVDVEAMATMCGKAADEIEQLSRVASAAKTFVTEFSVDVIQEHGYQGEWNDLCDAVFSLPEESVPTKDTEQTDEKGRPMTYWGGMEKISD